LVFWFVMSQRDEHPDETLRSLIRGGTRASLAAQIVSQLASLVILAILYRLLRPEDYGLLGMALPAVMLPRMAATLGVGAAIVQAPELTSGQRTSLFWLLQGLGLAAFVVTSALGIGLAAAYREPLLSRLCLALAGATLWATLGQTHQSLLERRLAFVPLVRSRVLAQLAGGIVAIGAASRGWGIWSLVIQQVVELALLTCACWRLESWRPGLPWHGEKVGGLAAFGGYFAATNLVFYLAQNLEKVLFPWLLGASAELAIGLFSQAMSFVMRIVYVVTAAFGGVMLPALSRARHDRALVSEIIGRFFRMTAVGLIPCGIGLFLVAPEVMLLLGGPQWRGAGTILRALAPLLLVQGLLNLTGSIFGALGQGRRLIAGSLVYLLLLTQGLIGGYLAATHFFPATGGVDPQRTTLWMAAAYTLTTLGVICGPYLTFCLKSAEITMTAALVPVLAALRGGLLMGITVWAAGALLVAVAPALDYRVRLAVLVAIGISAYLLFAWREVRWVWEEVR
jgi:O-antigen/teichoic acid export membrane protein